MNNPLNAELVRDGCCADWPKPCTYHEGFADGIEAVLRARTRLADEGDCHCDDCLTQAANMGDAHD